MDALDDLLAKIELTISKRLQDENYQKSITNWIQTTKDEIMELEKKTNFKTHTTL